MGRKQTGASLIHSVDKAMSLLDLLLERRRPMTLLEIAEASAIPKSTVYGMLSTLREHAMVEQRRDGTYYLGIRLFECGSAVSAAWDISGVAHPYLERLAAQTGASAFISRIDGGTVISFDYCPGTNGLHIVPEIGKRLSLHATSQGKLLLAFLSEDEALRRLSDGVLQAYTPHTATEPTALLPELRRIRAQGYSVEDGEYQVGLRSVSAPVYDHTGEARYAIGVIGLFRRVRSEEFQDAIRQTCRQAEELSAAMGYRSPLSSADRSL